MAFFDFGKTFAQAYQAERQRALQQEEADKSRTFQTAENEKSRINQNYLSKQQIDAAARNLRMQIENNQRQHTETLLQSAQQHKDSVELQTAQLKENIRYHNDSIALDKARNLMSYNTAQMAQNMSYFEQYGVAPPAVWQYDNEGRMLPAGDPRYWGMLNSGNSINAGNNRDIGIGDPVPVVQESVKTTQFPSGIIDNVNKLVKDIQSNKPYFSNYISSPTIGTVPNYEKKPLTTDELVSGYDNKILSSQIKNAVQDIKSKLKSGDIISTYDKDRGNQILQAASEYYQGQINVLGDKNQKFDINMTKRNAINKMLIDKLAEVTSLARTFNSKIPSWGNKGKQEVLQHP